MRFDHVGLNVADLAAMVAWYTEALDLKVEFEFALPQFAFQGTMLVSPAGHRIELLTREGSEPGLEAGSPVEAALTRGYSHFALDVADVDASYAALVGRRRDRPDVAAPVARARSPDGLCRRSGGQPDRAAGPHRRVRGSGAGS